MHTRGGPRRPDATALTEAAAEFHGPDWVLGQTTMAEVVDGTVVARMTESGRDALVLLVPGRATAAPAQLPQPCVSISRALRPRGRAGLHRQHARTPPRTCGSGPPTG